MPSARLTAPAGRRPPYRPRPARVVPVSTYRLQLHRDFTFDGAAAQADYLAALGVSHVYLSPILQAAPGSTHGYDVVDHGRVSEDLGGREGFDRLVDTLHRRGMGVVLDLVPNHMAVPNPAWLNAPLWSVLREGQASAYAAWFDIDWAVLQGQVLMPVLDRPVDELLRTGGIRRARDGGRDRSELVLRCGRHELPVRPGTEDLPLADLLTAQAYRLSSWREVGLLNYRRFFDITSLIAVRVEVPEVFEATHALLLELVRSGQVDGLRIDHPDGLADPGGYLERLAEATDGAWVVVEKILGPGEELPDCWLCSGTTGYEHLHRVQHVFLDPRGEGPLTRLYAGLTGRLGSFAEEVAAGKRQAAEQVLRPEVEWLVRIVGRVAPDLPEDSVRRAVVAVLVSMDRYRVYQPRADEASLVLLDEAVERAGAQLPEPDHPALAVVRDLAAGRQLGETPSEHPEAAADFASRFEQTCGPVMAKGVEDSACYRYARLVAANEVGGDPSRLGLDPAELHARAGRTNATWPTTLTTLSTHDTKRSEDVRARLAILAERPAEWAAWVGQARVLAAPYRHTVLDPATEYLLWQTLAGAWPLTAERFQEYAVKAVREAALHTSWADPCEPYESAVRAFVAGVAGDRAVVAHLQDWLVQGEAATRAVVLGQKLLQLVLPGVADVYQGTELVDLALVDPDNRRLVDFAHRAERLCRLAGGQPPRDVSDEKLLVTSRTLELRRSHPQWFTGTQARYAPVHTSTEHALAVGRGDASGLAVVAVVTRFPAQLANRGGWGEHTMTLPPGTWDDQLARPAGSPRQYAGKVPLAEVLAGLPVALLVRGLA